MNAFDSIRLQLQYSDEMNRRLLAASASFDDAKLDEPMSMGPGTLRKTLVHIYVGEAAWLERWKATPGFKWGSVDQPRTVAEISERSSWLWNDRDNFLATLHPDRLDAEQRYLDSTAGMFSATLHEMILQGIFHSAHHRAQAVNMVRRLGGAIVEVDFMYWRRRTP